MNQISPRSSTWAHRQRNISVDSNIRSRPVDEIRRNDSMRQEPILTMLTQEDLESISSLGVLNLIDTSFCIVIIVTFIKKNVYERSKRMRNP